MTKEDAKSMNLTLVELQELETKILEEIIAICTRTHLDYYLVYGSALGAVRHKGPSPWDPDVDIAIPYPQLQEFIRTMRAELPEQYYLNFYDDDPYYPELFPRIGIKGYSTKKLHIDVFVLVGTPSNPKAQRKFKNRLKFCAFVYKYGNFNPVHFGEFTTLKQKLFVPIVRTLLAPFTNAVIKRNYTYLCDKYPFEEADFIANAQFGYSMKEFIPKSYYQEGIEMPYEHLIVNLPKQYDKYLKHIYNDYMQIPSEKDRQILPYYRIDKRCK